MHMVIKVLVFADDEEDAINEAGCVLDKLCGDGQTFDYYNTFDEGYATERWGELPTVIKVCGDLGSEKCDKCDERFKCYTAKMNTMLEEAMNSTKQAFLENLGKIKNYLTTHTDDQLFEEDWFKFVCHQAGQYEGSCVWLYDQDGAGIRDNEHLQHVMSRWACNNNDKPQLDLKHKTIYVVPADVHY